MCWQRHAWLCWHRAWTISCETLVFFSIWMSLLSEVRVLHTNHCVSVALGTGNTALPQQPLAPWNCPSLHSISPSSAHTGLWTEKSHPKCLPDCQLTWEHCTLFISVTLCCYTDASPSKHCFNTITCLAWKFSISYASKPVKIWCNWHQKRHGSSVRMNSLNPKYIPDGEMLK